MKEALYGQDILLGDDMQAVIAANGEAVLSGGVETVLQDIKLRLFTPLGGLFYDVDFGSRVIEFVRDENTLGNRRALCAEVVRRVCLEPRVVPESVKCKVLSWDHEVFSVRATFQLIEETHPFNLVLKVGEGLEMVIKDGNSD